MKFRKFGKALLMTAISGGVVFSISSCVQSYSVGYLYVTGTQTASTTAAGVLSGFKIDHNTGKLTPINGLPISSGGANPGRAVLLTGGRFLYVLNQGSNPDGAPCSATDVCKNANITQFSIGGNGVLVGYGGALEVAGALVGVGGHVDQVSGGGCGVLEELCGGDG